MFPLISGLFNIGSGVANALGALRLANAMDDSYISSNNPLQAAMDLQEAAIAEQKTLYGEQANLALKESQLQAKQKADQANEFASEQAIRYLGSGVMLQGSPMIVMERTRSQAKQELDMITEMGKAQADFLRRQQYVMATNAQASLLGNQAQFITNQAQQRIARGTNSQLARQGAYDAAGRGLNTIFDLLGGL